MANSLSLSSPAIPGAAPTTLQQVQYLYATIDNVKDAPGHLRDLKMDIQAVIDVLQNMDMACPCDSPEIMDSAEVKAAIENCYQICTEFQALVVRWGWHAAENTTFWVDRWADSLSGQERTRAFKVQLNLCKEALAVALSTADIMARLHHEQGITNAAREMILKQNESFLQKEIDRADDDKAETEAALAQILVNESSWLSDGSEERRWELLQDIRRQQRFKDTFRKVCEHVLAITGAELTRHIVEDDTQRADPAGFLDGFIDLSSEEPTAGHDISDVAVDIPALDISGILPGEPQKVRSVHVCCLTLGILDRVTLDSHRTYSTPCRDLSPPPDTFLLEQTEHPRPTSPEDSRPELAPISRDLITATTDSPHSQPRDKGKPVCWDHGCQGRVFSSQSNLRRHQKEKARQEPACYCPRCGAYFSRTSGRDQHLAKMSCTRIRRYSNGRVRPNISKIQGTLDMPL